MAYMGRGGISSFGGNSGGGIETPENNNNDNDNDNDNRRYYRRERFRVNYYIPLDNTYVIFQMIATFIIFAIAGISFLTTYKSPVLDTIADTKRIILNSHIIITLVLLCFTVLANFFSKNKFVLVKRLIVIMAISIITIFSFWGIKAKMNSTYTQSKFEEIYEQEYSGNEENSKNRIDIGLTGVSIKSEKEYYVDKCVEAFKIFTIKMYSTFALNIFLIVLLIYQIIKLLKIQDKMDRLSKDDAILFDEEENIKM